MERVSSSWGGRLFTAPERRAQSPARFRVLPPLTVRALAAAPPANMLWMSAITTQAVLIHSGSIYPTDMMPLARMEPVCLWVGATSSCILVNNYVLHPGGGVGAYPTKWRQ